MSESRAVHLKMKDLDPLLLFTMNKLWHKKLVDFSTVSQLVRDKLLWEKVISSLSQ